MLCKNVIDVFEKVVNEINVLKIVDIRLKIINDKDFENRHIVEMNNFRQKKGRYKNLNCSDKQIASVASFLVFTHTIGDTGKFPVEIYDLQGKPLSSEYCKKLFGEDIKIIRQRIVVLLAARVAIRIANPSLGNIKEKNTIDEILHLYDLRDENGIIQKLLAI